MALIGVLLDSLASLPAGWHILNFGNQKNKIYTPLGGYELDGFQTQLVKAHYFPMTTTGICWSRAGALAFLDNTFPIFVSVNRFLRHWQTRNGKGYCFMPPLVTTTGADSDISRPAKTQNLGVWEKMAYGLKKQWQMLSDKRIAYLNKIWSPMTKNDYLWARRILSFNLK